MSTGFVGGGETAGFTVGQYQQRFDAIDLIIFAEIVGHDSQNLTYAFPR